MRLVRLAMIGVLAGLAPAQQDPDPEEHLALLRERLRARQADEKELLDLLVRHNMGFPVSGDRWFMMPVDEPQVPIDEAQQQLRREQAEITRLADRLDQLSAQIEGSPVSRDVPTEFPSTDFPPSAPLFEPSPDVVREVEPRAIDPQPTLRPQVDPRAAEVIAMQPPEGASLITGSANHSAIAGSLHNRAAELMREANRYREWNRADEARELDDSARGRLQLALRELEPLVAVEEPDFVDLFHQGQCLEALLYLDVLHADLGSPARSTEYAKRFEAMRQPYLKIMARDQRGTEQLGPWGQSAQTALRTIRWMSDFGDYEPTIPISSIQWNRK